MSRFSVSGDDKETASIIEKINLMGYRYTKGGRFHHILGNNDKGKAVMTLTDIYSKKLGRPETIGLGDSLNDMPMLEAVDIAVLVQKPGGEYDKSINLSNLQYAEGEGPYGWNSEILKIFMSS